MTRKVTPMLFNTEMVQALLSGQKTVTRRPLAPQPKPYNGFASAPGDFSFSESSCSSIISNNPKGPDNYADTHCPFGKPGDLIYVRETFHVNNRHCWDAPKTLHPTDEIAAYFKAGWERSNPTWKPSIHMPRWASRLTLLITSVSVERACDISAEHIISEGCLVPSHNRDAPRQHNLCYWVAEWHHAYGHKPELRMENNPWVWVIEFEVIHKNIDTYLQESKA